MAQNPKALLFLGSLLALVNLPVRAQGTLPLDPGRSIVRDISVDSPHRYTIVLRDGQFVRITAQPEDIPIAIVLSDPDGNQISKGAYSNGFVSISYIATRPGNHQLEVSGKASGKYEIRIDDLRAGVPADRDRVQADQLMREGDSSFAAGTPAGTADALSKYGAALQIRRNLGDKYDEAVLLHCLGRAHDRNGAPAVAGDYFKQALARFQSADGQGWDILFRNMSLLYSAMGGKPQTLNYLSGALPLVHALHNRRLEAVLRIGIAKIHEDLNEPQKALAQYDGALLLYRSSRAGEAITLTAIADADLTLAERQKAILYLTQALPVVQAVGDKGLQATILFGIGYVHNLLDEKQKAMEFYEKALPIFRAIGDADSEAYLLNFVGGYYVDLGEHRRALDYFEQALPLFRSVRDRNAEAYTLLYLGAVNFNLGMRQQASSYFQQSLALFRAVGDRFGEASALSSSSGFLLASGDIQKALSDGQEALGIWRSLGYRSGEAGTLSGLGFIYEAKGDTGEAIRHQDRALALFRLLGNPSGEANALFGIARCVSVQGNLDEAKSRIDAAVEIVSSLRSNLTSPELRASFLASRDHIYKLQIDILMQLDRRKPGAGYDAAAFQANERARARSLLEVLREGKIDIRQGVDGELLTRERSLQQHMNAREQLRLKLASRQGTSQEALKSLEREIAALAAEYQQVQTQIRAVSPHYAALTQPASRDLVSIQKDVLDQDSVLLEYSLGERRSYLWVVSASSVTSYELPARVEIETLAGSYYGMLTNPDRLLNGATVANRALDESADRLSRILLAPAVDRIATKRLLIVADGALQYLPFGALPEPATPGRSSGSRPRERRPLVINHEIVTLPSASVLAELRIEITGRPAALKTIAVVADPVFSAGDSRVVVEPPESNGNGQTARALETNPSDTKSTGELRLARLPGTRREAVGILELVPESERLGIFDFDANRSALMSPVLGQYRFLHIATHGLLNTAHPELSAIALSQVDRTGRPQEGFLRLNEIYNLRLPVELVVLSACQTAIGNDVRGEGLIGLTRGFMYAGASRVLASLWKVDDKATAVLMKGFYVAMLRGNRLSAGAALRTSQIEMLNSVMKDPYYWAAFTIQGEWR